METISYVIVYVMALVVYGVSGIFAVLVAYWWVWLIIATCGRREEKRHADPQ